jgi:hypothetical protein
MKPVFPAAVLLALLAGPALGEDALPTRKAGLWESKSTSQDGTSTAKQCIDDDTDRQAQDKALTGKACSKNVVTRTADGYTTETTCSIGQVTAEGKGVVTGDFATVVRTETTTTLKGIPGVDNPTPRKTVIEARRIGDCEPGQKPGDVIMPDGKVFHMGR